MEALLVIIPLIAFIGWLVFHSKEDPEPTPEEQEWIDTKHRIIEAIDDVQSKHNGEPCVIICSEKIWMKIVCDEAFYITDSLPRECYWYGAMVVPFTKEDEERSCVSFVVMAKRWYERGL